MKPKTSFMVLAIASLLLLLAITDAGKNKKDLKACTSKKCGDGKMCVTNAGKDSCMKAKPECAEAGAVPKSIKSKTVSCEVPAAKSTKSKKSKSKPDAPSDAPAKPAEDPPDPKEVKMMMDNLRAILKLYPSGKKTCPMKECPTFPPLPDPEETMKQAKEAIKHGQPEAIPPCIPLGKPGDETTRDALCLRYPNFCVLLPAPPAKAFAVFTEPFPCFLLTRPMFQIVEAAKSASPTSFEKCMWDYAICFLYACYPGMNPTVIATSLLQGKISVPKSVEDKLPEPVRKAWEMSKNGLKSMNGAAGNPFAG